ncbi:helix-turn-helix domain-containing protein [Pelagibius marinus]|uniref:helix-turn-helix domain-containing protein n=1 Tax=Pelagibius marinus TaxID=2762760 RepID=UPI001872E41C|nr:XRE family transcriptional regulator [Pelagibius marinus]
MSGNLRQSLVEKLRDKAFRHEYMAEHIRTGIAYQIRALRDKRGWSQQEMGRHLKKPQSVVSRLEDPDYGRVSLQTLIEVADVFDVGVLVRFVGYRELLERTSDLSPAALLAPSFDEEESAPVTYKAVQGTSAASEGARSGTEQSTWSRNTLYSLTLDDPERRRQGQATITQSERERNALSLQRGSSAIQTDSIVGSANRFPTLTRAGYLLDHATH